MDNQPANDILQVHIKTRDGVLFDGNAKAVTSWNQKGVFDILPEHANFICLIRDFITIHQVDHSLKQIKIESGVLRVVKNIVEIYVGLLPYVDTVQLPPAQTTTK